MFDHLVDRPLAATVTLSLLLWLGLAALLGLAGCSYAPFSVSGPGERVVAPGAPVPVGGGRRIVGKPYVMYGRLFVPTANPPPFEVGTAAWMAPDFHGRRTANGEVHDGSALTGAHPTMPLPSYAKVTNLENGRSLVLRIHDRGPFNKGRVIDVSRRAAELLGFARAGLARVRVEYLRPAPLDGDQSYERHYLAMQPWVRCRRVGRVEAVGCRVVEPGPVPSYGLGVHGIGHAASGATAGGLAP